MLYKIAYRNEIHVMTTKELITFAKFDEFVKSVFKRLPSQYTLVYKDSDEDIICLSNDADLKALSESGIKKVRIDIQPINHEDFYDETQEISIDLPVEKIEEPIEQTTQQTQKSVEITTDRLLENKSTFSDEKSIDESINDALNKILPTIVSQIKEEVSKSKINVSKVFEEKQIPKIIPETNVVHQGVTCDGCNVYPITGIRYKCAVCPDFDHCEKCESSCSHDHPFLKIRQVKHTPLKIFAMIQDQEDSFEFNGQRLPIPNIEQGLNLLGGILGGSRQHCPRAFGGFRQHFKRFAQGMKKQAEELSKNSQKPQTEQKFEKKEEKFEAPEPKVEDEDKNQPIITEELKTEKKVEKKPIFNTSTQELLFNEAAAYISDIMNQEYKKVYRFVVNYPGLTKEEILMKYLEQ